jgi:FMNH2-dependent dimethyl sulfone monooxygenase
LLDHEERYACAEEWVTLVKRLWTEDESFDHDGKFYKIKRGYLQPKPIQYPYPAIMNAGASERGKHFACKHCDLVFTNIRSHDHEVHKAHVASYRRRRRDGRAQTQLCQWREPTAADRRDDRAVLRCR